MDGKRPEHLQLTATQMRDPSVLGRFDLLKTLCNSHDILPSSIYCLDAKIVEITNLSPTVKGFKLSVKDGNDNTFKAGQWVSRLESIAYIMYSCELFHIFQVDFFIPTVGN